MKDIIIPPKRIKQEWLSLLGCFIVANLFNAYSIFSYNTSWSELYTQWLYVVLLSIAFYVGFSLLRGLLCAIRSILNK